MSRTIPALGRLVLRVLEHEQAIEDHVFAVLTRRSTDDFDGRVPQAMVRRGHRASTVQFLHDEPAAGRGKDPT